jgi:hypothetical protein
MNSHAHAKADFDELSRGVDMAPDIGFRNELTTQDSATI